MDLLEDPSEERRDSGLTSQEIERFIVDENLSELDRVKLFLSSAAHQLQQTCALAQMPTIFHEYGSLAYKVLFPVFTASLEHFNPQVQVAAGQAFCTILADESLSKDVGGWLLPTVLSMLNSNRSHEVVHAWTEVLCAMATMLPKKIILENLLKLAFLKGEVDETSQSRIVCGRILGAVAPLLDGLEIERVFLHKAMSLCQDTDSEVRICMCQQLNVISRGVGLDTTKRVVLPELYELLKDEEVEVHHAALECLVQMLDFLPLEIKKAKVLPVLRMFCGQNGSTVLVSLARLYGELMCKTNEKVRQLCAYNFPAMLKSIGARKYALTLHVIYMQLVQDPSSQVRSSVAASFHEVCKMLGKERTATYLKDAFLLLLKDSSLDVQNSLLPIIQHVLGQFCVTNEQQKLAIYSAIVPALLHSEKVVNSTHQWRLQLYLLSIFSQLPDAVASVRMRACLLLPLLKGAIKLPDDVAALERINFFATQRLTDNDRHVAAAARSVAEYLKHATVRCVGLDPGSDNSSSQTEFEATDKQREEEEWTMLSKEEQDEKKKLDEMLQRLKVDANRKFGNTAGANSGALSTTESEANSRRSAKAGGPAEKPGQPASSRSTMGGRFKAMGSASVQPSAALPSTKMLSSLGSVSSTTSQNLLTKASSSIKPSSSPSIGSFRPALTSTSTSLMTSGFKSQAVPSTPLNSDVHESSSTSSPGITRLQSNSRANLRTDQATKRN
ncbi:hypothetical protein O6H91_09G112900 [Diphasiastrum complanatum]|uniref:Uncharacterized protein n=1 Tax=Diphasiastrum complanatum TaxID=34168 RepID=A0ACC2CTF5_DIPCM|nr:hypothetical protein O6H91_09G112900 [Diphasiastrum complanatum]